MVKGCQRKIYYLKNTGSKYFEEAYLVLKREENGKAQASQTELSRVRADLTFRVIQQLPSSGKPCRLRSEPRLRPHLSA